MNIIQYDSFSSLDIIYFIKMWRIILIVSLCYAGTFATFDFAKCDQLNCHKLAPKIRAGNPEDILPAEEKLNEMCPAILAYLNCYNDTEGCLGDEMYMLADWDNATDALLPKMYHGVIDVFTDLCNTDSDLHKRYSANIVCIRKVLVSSVDQECASAASTLYRTYRQGSEEKVTDKEYNCMVGAHTFACVNAEILRECGEDARHTVVEIVKRVNLMKLFCSFQDFSNLKKEYLEFLKLEDLEKDIFVKAFDILKRK